MVIEDGLDLAVIQLPLSLPPALSLIFHQSFAWVLLFVHTLRHVVVKSFGGFLLHYCHFLVE